MTARKRDLQIATCTICVFLSLWLLRPSSAQAPKLASLQPPSSPERSLILVNGTGLDSGVVVWDAGLASERKLPSTIQGATMFSVPPNSKIGNHPVAIETPAGRSAPINFNVSGTAPVATPRLDGVTLADTKFEDDGKVRVILYVQGANIDVAAKVLIDGVETASSAHKAIYNNLFGADPKILGYPIRHYLSRIVPLAPKPRGSPITVQVINEAGETSNVVTYSIPDDPKTYSSAGDDIPDYVKLNGYDNGHGRIDLKALGADPFRKTIFVQVDVMQSARPPIKTTGNVKGTFDTARDMFANAPIINPYGPNGINLVIDSGGSVPRWNYLAFRDDNDPSLQEGSFWKLKTDHFDPKRQGLYHYAIWGRERRDGFSGYSNVDFDGTKVGESFMITMSEFPIAYQTVQSQAETFVHELGHDLGQKHGGTNHAQFKPNYWSDMSYSWQLRSSSPSDTRNQHPTCTQIYYGTAGATEHNGQLPTKRNIRLDYSEGMGRTLVGNNHSLDERVGVCGQPIDWNKNGVIDSTPVDAPVDGDDQDTGPQVEDMANWPNLLFNGPRLGGSHNPS